MRAMGSFHTTTFQGRSIEVFEPVSGSRIFPGSVGTPPDYQETGDGPPIFSEKKIGLDRPANVPSASIAALSSEAVHLGLQNGPWSWSLASRSPALTTPARGDRVAAPGSEPSGRHS